jgi:hypothetical protein
MDCQIPRLVSALLLFTDRRFTIVLELFGSVVHGAIVVSEAKDNLSSSVEVTEDLAWETRSSVISGGRDRRTPA